jgi:hypothetical protein
MDRPGRESIGTDSREQFWIEIGISLEPPVKIGDAVFLELVEELEKDPRAEIVNARAQRLAPLRIHGAAPRESSAPYDANIRRRRNAGAAASRPSAWLVAPGSAIASPSAAVMGCLPPK